ncbi:MAG TPA: capsular biosynthesis protein [Caulobacteraceae bacterium]|jgi:capsular polysaccharide export protein
MTAMPFGVADDRKIEVKPRSRRRESVRPRPQPPALRERNFLFLRGPFGSFFSRIADGLAAEGARVSKVVFDGGDLSDWGLTRGHVTYRESEDAWPAWIDRFIQEQGVTDLVVFNDCIEVHGAAIVAARRRGARVHVFEEGYFRPRWITLEAEGVNAYSPCPREPEFYRREGEALERAAAGDAEVGKPTSWLILKATEHYVWKVLLAPAYPRRRNPFALPVFAQIVGSFLRYVKNQWGKAETQRLVDQVISSRKPFFLALMQRAGDSQLWVHSNYTNESFAAEAIESFARHAPAEALLVFKLHPLDPGMVDYGSMVRRLAEAHGVAGRVILLDGGNLNALSHKARGAVTINSTAGLATIGFGCPTKVLGRAVYDIEGMTDRKPLSRFWLDPQAPDRELFLKFRNVMMARTQINGAFYTPRGMDLAIATAVRRMLG